MPASLIALVLAVVATCWLTARDQALQGQGGVRSLATAAWPTAALLVEWQARFLHHDLDDTRWSGVAVLAIITVTTGLRPVLVMDVLLEEGDAVTSSELRRGRWAAGAAILAIGVFLFLGG